MRFFFILFLVSFSSLTFAAGGNDKNPLWSAKAMGIAGAYTSSVNSSDAILFNPAGLSKDNVTYSLAALGVEGRIPIAKSGDYAQSPLTLSFLPAITYSRSLSKQWGWGVGVYPAGGLNIKFPNVSYASVDPAFKNFTPDSAVNVAILEVSPGLSYEVMPRLRVGVAYRMQFVQGELSQSKVISSGGTTLLATASHLEGKDTFTGNSFRFGAQYRSEDDKWGLGIVHRTPTSFQLVSEVDGTNVYTAAGAGATGNQTGKKYSTKGDNITATTSLPMNWSVGGDYRLSSQHHLFGEYTYTQYSSNKKVGLDGKVKGTDGTTTELQDMTLNWHDLHEWRLGYEMTNILPFTLRAGYIYATSVSNNKYADPSFQPPGTVQHYFLGTGHKVNIFNRDMLLDTALEYYSAGGHAHSEKVPGPNGTEIVPVEGNYTFWAISAGVSLSMFF